jgi:hypothetical protein
MIQLRSKDCPSCKGHTVFAVPAEALEAYRAGAYIQEAFGFLSADDRERLMTGYCAGCWETLFSEEDPF